MTTSRTSTPTTTSPKRPWPPDPRSVCLSSRVDRSDFATIGNSIEDKRNGDDAIREVGTAAEAPPVPVRRDRQEEEGRHRRRPRRDQPRGRRPRPPDPAVDHQEPPAPRREPGVPSVRPRPGGTRAAAVDRGVLQGTVCPRPRPRDRDPAPDRLEGRDRPFPAGRAQPGRDQPGSRPLLPGLSLQQHVRRRRRLHHAAGAAPRLSPRPRRHPGRRLRPGPVDVPQLPQQPDRRRRPIVRSSRRSSSWPASTTS